MGAARQVLHAGEPAQIAQAKDVLRDTRRKLYRILAEDSPETPASTGRATPSRTIGRRARGAQAPRARRAARRSGCKHVRMTTVTLTDGGMGQELLRRSKAPPTPLWSARVLIDEPDLVRDLHAEFIRAGARVITINSYAATPERLARDGVPEMFEPLQKRAIDLAEAARDAVATATTRC